MDLGNIGDFVGAFSGIPLQITFEDEENKKMQYKCVVHLTFKYYTFLFSGYAYEKRVDMRVNYTYDGVFANVKINADAIFKDLFKGDYGGDENKRLSGDLRDIAQTHRIKVEASAEYYDYQKKQNVFLLDNTGNKLVVQKEYTLYPATFAVWNVLPKQKGTRIFRRFAEANGNPIKTYTTYFKNFPTPIDYIVVEDENNKEKAKVISEERANIYKVYNNVINRVIDEECGVYLAWQNEAGSVSSWLFSPNYKEEIKTKSLGSFLKGYKTDFDYPLIRPFGMTATKTWTLHSDIVVMSEEVEELQGLLKSRYVYLYTGDKYGKEWERVMVQEGTHKFDVNSQDTHPFTVTIEFEPMRTSTNI